MNRAHADSPHRAAGRGGAAPVGSPGGKDRPAGDGRGAAAPGATRSTAGTRWLELQLPSVPENVGIARVAVAALAGQLPFTLSELEEIKVAVSEAVTNAVVHGYGHPHGVVTIRAEHDGVRLLVEIADTGRGIADVEQARQPAFSTDPERMGMGFAFMEAFMDRVEVESAPGRGTVVRMFKRPHPQETAASPGGSEAGHAPSPADPDEASREAAAGRVEGGGDADADAAALR